MENSHRYHEKPAKLNGLLWGFFSATATFSAFFLSVHIYAVWRDLGFWNIRFDNVFVRLYLLILYSAALYHGLYRSKTILFDLGFHKLEKIAGVIFPFLFLASLVGFIYIFFIP